MAEEEHLKKTNQVNLNMDAGEKEPTLEMKNIPGFDVLDSLPEEQKLKSYNDEFYSTLSNMKFLSLTIPPEDKLFYHFEKNNNASITSTAGQVFITINELKKENLSLKQIIVEVQEKINNLKEQVDNIEMDCSGDIINEIKNLEKKLQVFIVETKTETFKLIIKKI